MQERLERTRVGEWTFTGIDTALSGRLTIETAVAFHESTLTGVGAGAFPVGRSLRHPPDDPFRGGAISSGVYHAHQMYIVAAESGVIGCRCCARCFWV